MGFSIAWVAVRGKPKATILEELKLKETGDREEIPESPIVGAELPSGWYLVFGNRADFLESLPLGWLSINAELITCVAEEHAMFSEASGWRNGERIWMVRHEAEQGHTHLAAEGDVPPALSAIYEKLLQLFKDNGGVRSGVDYVWDAPVELAKSFTGYRHDHDIPGAGPASFQRLEHETFPSTIVGLLKSRRKG